MIDKENGHISWNEGMGTENKVVLVCDDEKMIAELLSKLLELEDYHPLVAYCAREAVDLLKEHKVDMAVVDYHLPDCNGPELIQRLHAINPELPIVMLSGDLGLTDTKVKEMGALAFCDKIADTDRLIEIINNQLKSV